MKVIVTSPMRTGSTWVYSVLKNLLTPERVGFVSGLEEANQIAGECSSCILKSHGIIDLDFANLAEDFKVLRLLRNFKDILISRALYCRNVRYGSKDPLKPEELEIVEQCTGMTDYNYVNTFLKECSLIPRWIEEIAVYERGDYTFTIYYEMLLYNTRDQLWKWVNQEANSTVSVEQIDEALKEFSFQRMRDAHQKGFVGSTGVGAWMRWLDDALVQELDGDYLASRKIAGENPDLRRPVSRQSL